MKRCGRALLQNSAGLFAARAIIDWTCTPVKWGHVWVEDPLLATRFDEASVDRAFTDPQRHLVEFEGYAVAKAPAPACGCCGDFPRVWDPVNHRSVSTLNGFNLYGEVYWRCAKHVGRSPCCIDGCGKTWALKGDDTYQVRFICGTHWREAPKWMRDRVAKIRKLAKRRGWTEQICRVHSLAWERCIATIVARRTAPPAESIVSSGPPPAGMLLELERLGL